MQEHRMYVQQENKIRLRIVLCFIFAFCGMSKLVMDGYVWWYLFTRYIVLVQMVEKWQSHPVTYAIENKRMRRI